MTLVWKETVLNVIQKEGKRFDADSIYNQEGEILCARSVFMLMKSLLRKEVGRIFEYSLKLALFNLIS